MTRPMQETPARMVEHGRISAFGHFRRPFTCNNILEADLFGLGTLGSKLLNPLRLKDWQHVAVFGPDFLFTFVIVNTGYLSSSFCYFVDRQSGERFEYQREASPGVAKLARELWADQCHFRRPGYRIEIDNALQQNRHQARIAIAADASVPRLDAELTLLADLERYQPLEVVLRLAPNRPAYSHKMACPAAGRIQLGERTIELDPATCLALIDVHKAYYPYRMAWRWASCAGYDAQGRVVGLNLTHNVIKDDTENNENGLWVGDQLSLFGAARFTFDERNLLAPWRIETEDGRVALTFSPQGERAGRINALLIASDYHQPYGTFFGHATDAAGVTHPINDFFGVTECHRARF